MVWNGIKPGIYESWNECQQNIKGYPDAKYMSFATKLEAEAEAAFNGNNHGYTNKQTAMAIKLEGLKNGRPKPACPALAVDAACNTATGGMEYRSVDAKTGRNQIVFDLIARAEKWLRENTWTTKLLKWETQIWGEIPADFGRR